MLPIFKYPGGKTRELPFIKTMLPSGVESICEPFAGGAAFSLDAEKREVILGDADSQVMNVYRTVRDSHALLANTLREFADTDDLEKKYYEVRAEMSDCSVRQAARFLFLMELSFSGMLRFNSSGQFNVPFGKKNRVTSRFLEQPEAYSRLLSTWDLSHSDFSTAIDAAEKRGSFIFADPPYLNRAGYRVETRSTLHEELAARLRSTRCNFMLVHVDCPEYRELYRGMEIVVRPFRYTMHPGGKGRVPEEKRAVDHLYIMNYEQRDWIF